MTLGEWIVLIVVIVGLVPVLGVMLWIYGWLFKFLRREEIKDLEAEQRLVEELGANPTVPIPPGRQVSVWILVAGFLLGAWPFFLLGKASLGWWGVALVALFSLFALRYFWERTVGFCNRVEALRSQALAKG